MKDRSTRIDAFIPPVSRVRPAARADPLRTCHAADCVPFGTMPDHSPISRRRFLGGRRCCGDRRDRGGVLRRRRRVDPLDRPGRRPTRHRRGPSGRRRRRRTGRPDRRHRTGRHRMGRRGAGGPGPRRGPGAHVAASRSRTACTPRVAASPSTPTTPRSRRWSPASGCGPRPDLVDKLATAQVYRAGRRQPISEVATASVLADYDRFDSALAALAQGLDPERPDAFARAEELDLRTLASLVDESRLGPEARFLVETELRGGYNAEPDQVSLLFAAQQTAVTADSPDGRVRGTAHFRRQLPASRGDAHGPRRTRRHRSRGHRGAMGSGRRPRDHRRRQRPRRRAGRARTAGAAAPPDRLPTRAASRPGDRRGGVGPGHRGQGLHRVHPPVLGRPGQLRVHPERPAVPGGLGRHRLVGWARRSGDHHAVHHR